MTADDAAPDAGAPEDAAPAEQPTEETAGEPDAGAETRRRFQEALERKRHREAHGDGAHGTGKNVTQHDVKRQRTFRRKSG